MSCTKQQQDEEDDPWRTVGGNAVNEKTRKGGTASATTPTNHGFDPLRHKAHLYHALEGLDRYPNYLSRWNDGTAVDRLEQALQAQLDRVRSQRQQVAQHQAQTHAMVQDFLQQAPQHAELLQRPTSWNDIQRDILHPAWSKAVEKSVQKFKQPMPPLPWTTSETETNGGGQSPTITLDAAQLEPLMEQEVPDVYSLPLFQPAFCQRLLAYLQDLSAFRQARYNKNNQPQRSSTLHTRWVDLDHVGLSWLNDLLVFYVMEPVSRHLFVADVMGTNHNDHGNHHNDKNAYLDWRQGYLASYTTPTTTDTVRPRQGLTAHTDDSEVTLNISLNGGQFTGGNLDFYGLRGTPEEGQYQGTYEPDTAGKAILHTGRYLHAVTDLTAGDRFALIIWARSWQGTRATSCPCCWLQRRQQQAAVTSGRGRKASTDACICGAAWN